MATTKTTKYEIPMPPLGTIGTADGYITLMQTADNNIKADIVLAKNIAPVAAATGVDTITATYDPVITLTAGTRVILVAAGANTGAATFAPNSLTAKPIKKYVSTALAAGDIPAAGYPCELEYDATNWILLNPSLEARLGGASAPSPTVITYLDASSTVQGQLNAKAPIASPTFTGVVTMPVGLTGFLSSTMYWPRRWMAQHTQP